MTHLLALVATTLVIPLSAHAALKQLTFQKDLLPREARAWEYEKAMTSNNNTEVSFRLDGEPKIEAGAVQLNGIIENSSGEKKTIFIAGDREALKLDLETNTAIKLRDPKKPNPPMYALEIPAKSEVKITGSTPLDRYIYEGAPETTLSWAFLFWNPPRPHGTFKIKLPTATEAKLATFKIEFQKFAGDEQSKLTANLKNVSNETQIFCRSSQVNFYWNLKNVDGSEIKTIERMDVEYETRPMAASDCWAIKANETHELETANVKKRGAVYDFETPHMIWKALKPGQFNVWFQALNSAVGAEVTSDQKVVEAVRTKAGAVKPPKTAETTETTQAVSIP